MSHMHSLLALSLSRRDMDDISTPRFSEVSALSNRSPSEFEPDQHEEDVLASTLSRKPGLLAVKYKKAGIPRLYEEDDTTDPLGPLPKLMNERLALVETELSSYEQRRLGVGKALSFMARIEAQISSVNQVDGERARTAYAQEAMLSEQRALRKTAELRAREVEAEAVALRGKVQTLQKRIFVLEKQHDLEMLSFVEGFRQVLLRVKEEEGRVTGLLTAMAARVAGIAAVVADQHARRAEILAERLRAAEKESFMSVEEYTKNEPLTQKGIKSYLILHNCLMQAQAVMASKDDAMALLRCDHITQMGRCQRRLQEVEVDNAQLRAEVEVLKKRK